MLSNERSMSFGREFEDGGVIRRSGGVSEMRG
jgi:hypothetical protein